MLVITQLESGVFECVGEDATGSPIVGRGSSALESIGSWAVHTGIVTVQCSPPAVMNEWAITTGYDQLTFKGPDGR